jgi:hypothetical protein
MNLVVDSLTTDRMDNLPHGVSLVRGQKWMVRSCPVSLRVWMDTTESDSLLGLRTVFDQVSERAWLMAKLTDSRWTYSRQYIPLVPKAASM